MKTVGIIALAVCLSVSLWSWQIADQKPAAPTAPTASTGSDSRLGMDGPVRAEEVFKNIEIFKGKPATQVLIAMNAISGNLGFLALIATLSSSGRKMTSQQREPRGKCFV